MEYQKEINDGFNQLFRLEDSEGNKFVGKITKPLDGDPFNVRLVDPNQRAKFVYNVADYLRLPSLPVEIKSLKEVNALKEVDINDHAEEEVFLRPYIHKALSDFDHEKRTEIIKNNLSDILGYVALHIFVGNYDKKTDDYLVTKQGNVISVDHQLSGPHPNADNNSKSIGAYALPFDMDKPEDTGWCLEGGSNQNGDHLSLIEYFREKSVSYDDFHPYINRIQSMTSQDIDKLMNDMSFQKRKEHKSYLIKRKEKVGLAIKEWVSKSFPLKPEEHLNQELEGETN